MWGGKPGQVRCICRPVDSFHQKCVPQLFLCSFSGETSQADRRIRQPENSLISATSCWSGILRVWTTSDPCFLTTAQISMWSVPGPSGPNPLSLTWSCTFHNPVKLVPLPPVLIFMVPPKRLAGVVVCGLPGTLLIFYTRDMHTHPCGDMNNENMCLGGGVNMSLEQVHKFHLLLNVPVCCLQHGPTGPHCLILI